MARRRSPVVIPETHPATCTIDLRQEALAQVPFFSHLDAEAIAEVDRRCVVRDVDAGDAVYHHGDRAERLYVVATGVAKLTRATLDGREVLFALLATGDYLGAVPSLGADTYAEAAWALTPLCVLSLGAEEFGEVLDAYPSVARAGLEVIGQRLRLAQDRVHRLSTATIEQRVADVLLVLADRVGVRRAGRLLLEVPLGRDDLAAMTGAATETVSRVLAQLRRDGVVDTGRQWVAIRDRDRLADLAAV